MNFRRENNTFCRPHHRIGAAGFTLIEFLIAMAMFVVLGGAVLEMFAKQAPYFTRQQNLVGVNIAMQNAVSQMQIDLANAGTGYYPGIVIPSWPIGITIVNQDPAAPACNIPATFTYTQACFDKLNILTVNSTIPPVHPTNSAGGITAGSCSTTTGSPFYILPSGVQTPAQAAAGYNVGDQVLLVKAGGGGGGTKGPTSGTSTTVTNGAQINTFVVTAVAAGANNVALSFNVPNPGPTNSTTDDPLGITTTNNSALNLGTSFCASDWVMKLEPTTYQIDATTNPQNPTLQRVQNGVSDNIAEQIIGFKVGAATWVVNSTADVPTYSFYGQKLMTDTPQGYQSDFALIRSVRVSLIARTNPNPDPSYTFRNTFDGGPYQVVDATVVINPRNMTMNGN
jgi:prepilin-type N-terminal cleavage/methylation domain-containing protein